MLFRRNFITILSAALAAPALAETKNRRIKLGFDNFTVRAMGWKAPQLLDYAAQLRCDALFIGDLTSYDSLENAALRRDQE